MSKIEVNAIEPQCGTTLTLGANNDKITLGTGASFGGGVAAIKWETTAQAGDFGALSGRGYFVNTTSAPRTVTLPASPSAGDIVAIADYAGTAATNNITIARNGSNINGAASNITISKNNSAITLFYVDGTQGWKGTDTSNLNDIELQPEYITASGGTISCCGNYRIHTFTGPGTFTVCSVGNPLGSDTIQYLIVGAGGGGGHDNGGGGGGGAVVTASCEPVCVQAYPIAVGAGGAGGPGAPCNTNPGSSGNASTFYSITALRGGGGRTSCGGAASTPVSNGGGGAGVSSNTAGCSGTATSPIPANATTFGANSGGNGTNGSCSVFRSGGGGGAGGNGNPGLPGPTYSKGGDGTPSNICGTTYIYAGGGGGGVFCNVGGIGGPGGAGGGGGGSGGPGAGGAAGPGGRNSGTAGQNFPSGGGGPAGANTGSGGGGSGRATTNQGGNGGSGIVIIKYKYQN